MTTMTEVKQPNFLMMKRVWIAIALPIVIFYFLGIQGLVQLAIVWVFASIMLLMFAYKKFRIKKWNASTWDHFGEQDGMWSHEFGSTSMKLDQHRGLIHLKEENKQKTYPFSAVKEWRYNLSTTRQRTGLDRELDRTHDFKESGFYIAVDDVLYPEWRVMFFPTSGDFNSQEGARNTELQLIRWMQIFDNVINKK
ncbi:DUF4755 domain-containing protein [Winslowiella arboricola]|uniref:DUF4755 domain-containing protein n=1 Tax=Winslowiella arboricola TaxID=2978220 RepID=UPI00225E238F|nr:DUF4755 domain-containing protein [Winslowiella arboricola]MCU5773024.1 DUF4755 domain-containing protein [Winslowiella arboricola]